MNLLMVIGSLLFGVSGILFLVIQSRLWNVGLVKTRWTTLRSAARMIETYISVAEKQHWSPVVGYVCPVFLVLSLLLIFLGVKMS